MCQPCVIDAVVLLLLWFPAPIDICPRGKGVRKVAGVFQSGGDADSKMTFGVSRCKYKLGPNPAV